MEFKGIKSESLVFTCVTISPSECGKLSSKTFYQTNYNKRTFLIRNSDTNNKRLYNNVYQCICNVYQCICNVYQCVMY